MASHSQTERSVQKALNKLGEQRTVLVIAHRLGTIQNADQIVVLDAGKVIETGDHATLVKKEHGTYKRMFEMQARAEEEGEGEEEEKNEGGDAAAVEEKQA